MSHQEVLNNTLLFVKQTLENAEGGHDWFHIERVYNNALLIAESEVCDPIVVKLAALLHDIADSKFHNGDESIGPKTAKIFLETQKVDELALQHILKIIENISFKGGKTQRTFSSIELDIVQDADRLDAIGAIGIARTFHYGGYKNRVIYDPNIEPNLQMTQDEYKNSQAPTLNHFYEKLLLIKDKMNTQTGKQMALERHQFMVTFLAQFYAEWNGDK
jgi:uncharacterized protein